MRLLSAGWSVPSQAIPELARNLFIATSLDLHVLTGAAVDLDSGEASDRQQPLSPFVYAISTSILVCQL